MSGPCGPLPPDPTSVPLCFPTVWLPQPAPVFLPHSRGTCGAPTHTVCHLLSGRWDLGLLLQALSRFSSTLERKVRVTRHREVLSHFPSFL